MNVNSNPTASHQNKKKLPVSKSFLFTAGVVYTMGYSGAGGKLIHEKSQKSKISCQTPFKTAPDSKKTFTNNCYTRD
jgi:hypothetical protein